jgi:hypothetical protein
MDREIGKGMHLPVAAHAASMGVVGPVPRLAQPSGRDRDGR